jgi:hypothetical protein
VRINDPESYVGDSLVPCAVKATSLVSSLQNVPKWVGTCVSNHHNI